VSAPRLRVSRCPAPGVRPAALREAHPTLFPLTEAQAEALPGAAGAWVISCGAGPGGGAALWWLSAEEIPELEPASLGAEALRAVEDARRLLRALPWGWSALPDRPLQLGRAARLDAAEGGSSARHGRRAVAQRRGPARPLRPLLRGDPPPEHPRQR
jgi:hypothetical protein